MLLAYSLSEGAQQFVNALSLGSVYALLAIGIAAVFAVVGLINFAHGEVLTLAGFAMLLAANAGWPWETFIPIAIVDRGRGRRADGADRVPAPCATRRR